VQKVRALRVFTTSRVKMHHQVAHCGKDPNVQTGGGGQCPKNNVVKNYTGQKEEPDEDRPEEKQLGRTGVPKRKGGKKSGTRED